MLVLAAVSIRQAAGWQLQYVDAFQSLMRAYGGSVALEDQPLNAFRLASCDTPAGPNAYGAHPVVAGYIRDVTRVSIGTAQRQPMTSTRQRSPAARDSRRSPVTNTASSSSARATYAAS